MVDCSLFGIRKLVSTLVEKYAVLHLQHYKEGRPVKDDPVIEEALKFLRMTNVFEADAPQIKFPTIERYIDRKPVLKLVKPVSQQRSVSL